MSAYVLGYEIGGSVYMYVACTWMYMLGHVTDKRKWEEEIPHTLRFAWFHIKLPTSTPCWITRTCGQLVLVLLHRYGKRGAELWKDCILLCQWPRQQRLTGKGHVLTVTSEETEAQSTEAIPSPAILAPRFYSTPSGQAD